MLKRIFFFKYLYLFAPYSYCYGAESGGMPQLDPEFWISQVFWLVISFGFLFIILSKFILPTISDNLERRKSQILENIETAEKQRQISDNNLKEFEKKIYNSKVKANSLINETKKKLIEEINNKKEILENEIDKEIKSAEDEIKDLQKNSVTKINQIANETASELLIQLIGSEINKSNISAIVEDLLKKEKHNGI